MPFLGIIFLNMEIVATMIIKTLRHMFDFGSDDCRRPTPLTKPCCGKSNISSPPKRSSSSPHNPCHIWCIADPVWKVGSALIASTLGRCHKIDLRGRSLLPWREGARPQYYQESLSSHGETRPLPGGWRRSVENLCKTLSGPIVSYCSR